MYRAVFTWLRYRRERQFAFEVGQIELKLLVLETWPKLMSPKKKEKKKKNKRRVRTLLKTLRNFTINTISTARPFLALLSS